MGYSEDMASFIQYRAGVGELSDVELAMLIYRLVVGGTTPTTTSTGGTTGGTVSGPISIKSGNSAELLEVVGGKIGISNFPVLNAGRLPVYRQDRALTQNFTIATGATQSDWFTVNSDSKLLLLEVPAMTGTSLQVRWRHPVTTGTANPIVDAFGTPLALTIGATSRIFSSDALAPLARCVLGDGEISFVSNVAEGAARTLKLYY